MTKCIIILKLVSCTIVPQAPPVHDPAEAARLLQPYQYVYHEPLPDGPRVFFIDSSPTSGPFGSFPSYSFEGSGCCSTYEINTRTGAQWLDGIRVPALTRGSILGIHQSIGLPTVRSLGTTVAK